jgi:hypothetical protein
MLETKLATKNDENQTLKKKIIDYFLSLKLGDEYFPLPMQRK